LIDKVGLKPTTNPDTAKTSAEERLTVIIVSSHGRARSIGLNTRILKVLAWACLVIFIATSIFITSYRMLGDELAYLRYLDVVADSYKEQIQELQDHYTILNERLVEAEAVESEIRDMLGNEGLLPQSYVSGNAIELPVMRISSLDVSRSGSDIIRPLSGADISRGLLALQAKADLLDELTANVEERASKLHEVSLELLARSRATPTGYPVEGTISSEYGWRTSPFGYFKEFHPAIDIAASTWEPIVVTADGLVTFAGYRSGYGYTIEVDHGYGYSTLYAHCCRLKASYGQKVTRGDVVAYVGESGRATGPHLHYEVHVNGETVDPKDYLSTKSREVDHGIR
jgi:murein DD-endopeptidase MepM/ murein hydrolase activator NlpD